MKNIAKILFALVASVSLISFANAGELTVTGTAKATYNIVKGGTAGANAGKGIGVANEIDFGAKGELDNGWTWNYQVQFDPGSGNSSTVTTDGNGNIDDTQLTLTTNFGTIGVFVSEGGLDTDNAASRSVYGRPTDLGWTTGIADGPGIDGFSNIQYHLPAGVLPFGATFKAAYATGQNSNMTSANAVGTTTDLYGTSAEQYQVTVAPIEGLKVGADYYAESGAGNATNTVVQKFEAGSVYATYTAGPASFGISRTLRAPLILSTSATATTIGNATAAGGNADSVRLYTSNKYSAAFNVNENLSLSYEMEKSNREKITNAAEYDLEATAVQAAYTMGGMTIAVSHGKVDNASYTQNNDVEQTLLAVSMAF
jgi:hypothetical protein